MKKVNVIFSTTLMLLVFMAMGTLSFAQGGNGNGRGQNADGFCMNIPDLTQEQQDKIEAMRTTHQKTMLANRNQLNVKKAQLEQLMTADKPDAAAINKMIDEMSVIKTEMQKKKAEHRLAVRGLLTDAQRVYFDSHRGGGKGRGNSCGKGFGNGRGGNCNGSGNGRRNWQD
jgi:Spy/CpxP family protein refolding chaperone